MYSFHWLWVVTIFVEYLCSVSPFTCLQSHLPEHSFLPKPQTTTATPLTNSVNLMPAKWWTRKIIDGNSANMPAAIGEPKDSHNYLKLYMYDVIFTISNAPDKKQIIIISTPPRSSTNAPTHTKSNARTYSARSLQQQKTKRYIIGLCSNLELTN